MKSIMEKNMKVWIRGSRDNGPDIIKKLELLGGRNNSGLTAMNRDRIYYINHKSIIDCSCKDGEIGHLITEEYRELTVKELQEFNAGDYIVDLNNDDFNRWMIFKSNGNTSYSMEVFGGINYDKSFSANGYELTPLSPIS